MATLNQANRRIQEISKQLDGFQERSLAQNKQALAAVYRESFNRLSEQLNQVYLKYGNDKGLLTRQTLNKYDRLLKLQNEIQVGLREMTGELITNTQSELYRQFRNTYYVTGYGYESTLGVTFGFTQINQASMLASVDNYYDFKTWKESYRKSSSKLYGQVKNEISIAMSQGQSHTKTARSIRKYFNGGYNDAVRIVRTEQLRANSVAQLDSINQVMKGNTLQNQGIELLQFWIASLDNRTRTDHRSEDGKNPDKEGYYYLGATRTKGPGLSGSLDQDINCRCAQGTSFEGIKGKDELTRNARFNDVGPGTQAPYMKYPEWQKKKGITNAPKKRKK